MKKIVITETVLGEQAAKDRAAELENGKGRGVLTAPSKERLADFLLRWLHDVKKMELRARTYDDYRRIIDRYVVNPPKGTPRIGTIRLDKLNAEAFQRLYSHLWEAEGLSPRTVQYCHVVLRQAMKYAVSSGLRSSNPTDNVTLPKHAMGDEPMDDEHEKKFKAMTEIEAGRELDFVGTGRKPAPPATGSASSRRSYSGRNLTG